MFRNIKRIPRFIDKFRRLWMKMAPRPRQIRPDGAFLPASHTACCLTRPMACS